jgi:ATP sulfurylase
VVESNRLSNGLLFGLPVVLDTDSEEVAVGDRVLLTYNGQVGVWLCVWGVGWGLNGVARDQRQSR